MVLYHKVMTLYFKNRNMDNVYNDSRFSSHCQERTSIYTADVRGDFKRKSEKGVKKKRGRQKKVSRESSVYGIWSRDGSIVKLWA